MIWIYIWYLITTPADRIVCQLWTGKQPDQAAITAACGRDIYNNLQRYRLRMVTLDTDEIACERPGEDLEADLVNLCPLGALYASIYGSLPGLYYRQLGPCDPYLWSHTEEFSTVMLALVARGIITTREGAGCTFFRVTDYAAFDSEKEKLLAQECERVLLSGVGE